MLASGLVVMVRRAGSGRLVVGASTRSIRAGESMDRCSSALRQAQRRGGIGVFRIAVWRRKELLGGGWGLPRSPFVGGRGSPSRLLVVRVRKAVRPRWKDAATDVAASRPAVGMGV